MTTKHLTNILKYGDTVTIKISTRNLIDEELEFEIWKDVNINNDEDGEYEDNSSDDSKYSETVKLKIDKEGNGEETFTIPKDWENKHKVLPQQPRYFYLKSGDLEFPRAYYVANPNKTEEENKSNSNRIRALMLKVAKDDVRDGFEEYVNAVVLGEELKLEEKNNENKDCECEARVRAYMRMLRVGEGTEGEIGYTKLFGGKDFTKSPHNKDMSDHPQIKVYWYTKKDGTKMHSSASGAYQVMGYTWSSDNMRIQRKVYGIKDFKQESQDLFCIILFKHKRKGMLKLIVEGKIKEATEKYGSYEWASLPPGRYGQPNKTMAKALELYEKFLKEELAEKSDLHIKKGFLKKFGVSCKCGKKIKTNAVENDFGLVQVTKLGNPYIINSGTEDSYSYTKKDGTKSSKGQHGDDWMLPKKAQAFSEAVYKLVKEYPKQKIYLGDCSAYNPSKNLGHSSTGAHSNGNAFDCQFLKSDGSGSNKIANLSEDEVKINGRFIALLKETGHFSTFYTDNGKIPSSVHSSGHDNHIHGN